MLQQTQVEQVIPYFKKFIRSFATVYHLANASEQEVLKIWEGLGYYSRARNLLKTARILTKKYNGVLPKNRDQLIQLPGFGDYITNAVLSLAFNLPLGVVDGNIKRVVTRLYMINDDIRKSQTQRKIQRLMDQLLPEKSAAEFNESMMELGAVLCLPRAPLCNKCPISTYCLAFKQNAVHIFPFKSPKAKVPVIQSISFIIKYHDSFLIGKRPSDNMLAGLWEFPSVRTNHLNTNSGIQTELLRREFGIAGSRKKFWEPVKHSYTHFHLRLSTALFEVDSEKFQSDFYAEYRWCSIEEIKDLPLHKAMWKVLQLIEADLKVIA
jgi:A/G-specific adenine glycosylase